MREESVEMVDKCRNIVSELKRAKVDIAVSGILPVVGKNFKMLGVWN